MRDIEENLIKGIHNIVDTASLENMNKLLNFFKNDDFINKKFYPRTRLSIYSTIYTTIKERIFNKCSMLYDDFILSSDLTIPDNLTGYIKCNSEFIQKYLPIFTYLETRITEKSDKTTYLILIFIKTLTNSTLLLLLKELVIISLTID